MPHLWKWVRDRLELYGLYVNQVQALKKYPDFERMVRKILNEDRLSKATEYEQSEYELALDIYSYRNGDTFLNKILPFLIKDHRRITTLGKSANPAGSQGQSTSPEEPDPVSIVVSYLRSAMEETVNRDFTRTFLPFRESESQLDEGVIKAMQKEDGMTNPRPDRVYSVSKDRYTFPHGFRVPDKIGQYLEIVKDTHHAFFIIEGKSSTGIPEDAQNQASRGGASLVNSARLLRKEIGLLDVDTESVGPDVNTFVYSATLSPLLIEYWVNWAEVFIVDGERKTRFNMSKLHSIAIGDTMNLGLLRRLNHNILDWGCGARFDGLKPVYEAIVTHTNGLGEPAAKKSKTK